MDSPLFSPCFFGKSPCPAWTLPDRGFPCYRFPHAGDRASKVRCFYFFVLNTAIRMTISNSTAPTSIIPKPSDVSHIQMVAAQTIFRFPSILTLLISLPWGDGRLLDTGGGGRTRTNFNPFPSCEGRPDFTLSLAMDIKISIHSPHARGDSINFQRIHRIQGSLYNTIHFTRFREFFQSVLGRKNAVYAVRSSPENHDSFTFAQPFLEYAVTP